MFLSFTRKDLAAALQIDRALQEEGYLTFLYVSEEGRVPSQSVEQVGRYFASADHHFVVDTPNARKSFGVWFEALMASALALKGGVVHVSITGEFDSESASPDWKLCPFRKSTAAIIVRDAKTSEDVTRQHVDLANANQERSPVWHLQLGGLAGPGHKRAQFEWLDLPRWPIMPMDFVLVTELAVFCFFPSEWKKLATEVSWQKMIKRSEDYLHADYLARLGAYQAAKGSLRSWLAHPCNVSANWNPRPS